MIQLAIVTAPINDLSRARDSGSKQTCDELNKLFRLAGELALHINNNMHSPALRILEKELGDKAIHPLILVDDLVKLCAAAMRGQEAMPQTPKPARRGRHKNQGALHLARMSASAYEMVTGKKPTITTDPVTSERRGPFIEFVRAIFDAAEKPADPTYYAQEAIRQGNRR
jgi:hypothetical protein